MVVVFLRRSLAWIYEDDKVLPVHNTRDPDILNTLQWVAERIKTRPSWSMYNLKGTKTAFCRELEIYKTGEMSTAFIALVPGDWIYYYVALQSRVQLGWNPVPGVWQ